MRAGPDPQASADVAPRHAHIPGWGSDLDHALRPAVPMERTPPRIDVAWTDPPPQQPFTVEILRSVERPEHSRTFGTRLPPKGVSGAIRRAAFRRSENDLRHWLMLLAADRVEAVGGLARDVGRSPAKLALVGLGLCAAAAVAWLISDA